MISIARYCLVGVESVREIPEHEARRMVDFGSTYCLVRDGRGSEATRSNPEEEMRPEPARN